MRIQNRCITWGLHHMETFYVAPLYSALVDRLLPVAGRGDVEQIRLAAGPLFNDRPGLNERLADLEPCPVRGVVTANEIKICIGEHGDIWPAEIRGLAIAQKLGN